MATTAANPPAAAARAPVSMVSLYSSPGSRRWTCRSISPGTIHFPRQSITRVPGAGAPSPFSMAAMAPSRTTSVPAVSMPDAGSRILPPTSQISAMDRFLELAGGAKQHGHADGDAALHLVEDQAARAVGEFGLDLHAAVHRSRVQDHRALLGPGEGAAGKAEVARIV